MGRARKQTADTPAPADGEPAPEAKPKRKPKADAPAPTTAGRLASLLKTARDTMRKDKGLNGDLDRLPLLTWLMILKFLDDKEAEEESRAKLARKAYQPTIEAPYRWRDWVVPAT